MSHDYIQELSTLLKGCKISKDFHQEISFEHTNYFYFSIFIFRILKYFFNSYNLSSSFYPASIDFSKSSLPNQFDELNIIAIWVRRCGVQSSFSVHSGFHIEISTFVLKQFFDGKVLFFTFPTILFSLPTLFFAFPMSPVISLWLFLIRLGLLWVESTLDNWTSFGDCLLSNAWLLDSLNLSRVIEA